MGKWENAADVLIGRDSRSRYSICRFGIQRSTYTLQTKRQKARRVAASRACHVLDSSQSGQVLAHCMRHTCTKQQSPFKTRFPRKFLSCGKREVGFLWKISILPGMEKGNRDPTEEEDTCNKYNI